MLGRTPLEEVRMVNQVNTTASDQERPTPSYALLRKWYLARLRKSLQQSFAGSDLTPATLIKRDEETLERISRASAGADYSATANVAVSSRISLLQIVFLVWCVVVIAFMLRLLLENGFDPTESWMSLLNMFHLRFQEAKITGWWQMAPLFILTWPIFWLFMLALSGKPNKSLFEVDFESTNRWGA
jgi:hypothetical protein